MTTNKLPCVDCEKITLWQKIFKRERNAERLANNRETAIEHVDTHRRGMAHGEVKDEVKAIANSNNGGK